VTMANRQPQRALNLAQTSAIIIGTVIGSGIFINIPITAHIAGTPWLSVLIWFLGGVLWIPQIFILAELGSAYPNQGFAYHYLYKAGSPLLAFIYTWIVFITGDTPSITIIALLAASALTFFFPVLEVSLYAKMFAAVVIAVLTAIHYRSVRTGGNFQIVITVAKLTPLAIVVFLGLFWLGQGHFTADHETVLSGKETLFGIITAGIATTVWAYAGFGNILYMAGEVKNPKRNLPKALIGSMLFVMLAYTLISAGVHVIVPYDQLIAERGAIINPFIYIEPIKHYAGSIFAIAVFISMIGALNAAIMAQPRLEYAMARDGLFFKAFAYLHPKYLTPAYSIVIQSTLAVGLFFMGDIENLLGYFTISYILGNMLVYGSIFFLRKRADYQPSYRSPWWFAMATLSIIIQIYIVYGTFSAFPTAGVLASLGLIIAGLPAYFYFAGQRKRQQTN
ncbi:MAG: amino acid permease, partial [Caldithrix sp.]|nr:amino acid permease [Caldithrix sp.]